MSSNRISIFESSLILGAKKILVTEGTYDKKYIEKAISVFTKISPKYNILRQISIIPAGSAGNAKALYDDVLSKQLDVIDVIVFLFDYDKGGLDGWKNINAIASNKIIPIFYQNNYNNDYDTERKNISNNDTYMVEDLFSPESYKEKVEYYLQFNDEWFEGFKPVLNKLITVFNL